MRIHNTFFLFKAVCILSVTPLLVYGYASGPDPGRTGAPGPDDVKTSCIGSGCHTGTINAGPGSVKVVLPSGNTGTYTPGQSMQLLVQITDSTKVSYGFEMTARMGTGNLTQAGDFSTVDANTQVVCGDTSVKPNGKTCPSGSPNEYIEHNFAGYTASLHKTPSFTYTVNWTPPATASGPITLYAAGNCGTGTDNQNGTDVYNSTLTLQPGTSSGNAPTIDPGGIVPLYSTSTTIQPGSWISLYSFVGKNLSDKVVSWNGDFPTSLNNVSVKINNKPAALWFVSPSQINLQAPDDTATGTVPVTVTNANGTASSTVTLGVAGPAFLQIGDGKHATGVIITPQGNGSQAGGAYDLLGPTGFAAGFRPVKKGETLVLYGIGFGPTSPVVPAGKPFGGSANMVTPPQMTLGNIPLVLSFSGISGFAGLYQFNTTVPQNVASGEQPLQAIVNGISTPTGVMVSVQ